MLFKLNSRIFPKEQHAGVLTHNCNASYVMLVSFGFGSYWSNYCSLAVQLGRLSQDAGTSFGNISRVLKNFEGGNL